VSDDKKLEETNVERFRGRALTLRGPDFDGIDLGVSLRSEAGNEKNREQTSHEEFFKARNDRQKLRFTRAMEELLARTASATGGLTSVKTMTVSDETWQQLMSHPESWESEGFKPLSQYQNKIIS